MWSTAIRLWSLNSKANLLRILIVSFCLGTLASIFGLCLSAGLEVEDTLQQNVDEAVSEPSIDLGYDGNYPDFDRSKAIQIDEFPYDNNKDIVYKGQTLNLPNIDGDYISISEAARNKYSESFFAKTPLEGHEIALWDEAESYGFEAGDKISYGQEEYLIAGFYSKKDPVFFGQIPPYFVVSPSSDNLDSHTYRIAVEDVASFVLSGNINDFVGSQEIISMIGSTVAYSYFLYVGTGIIGVLELLLMLFFAFSSIHLEKGKLATDKALGQSLTGQLIQCSLLGFTVLGISFVIDIPLVYILRASISALAKSTLGSSFVGAGMLLFGFVSLLLAVFIFLIVAASLTVSNYLRDRERGKE